jgi:hypothetical protein
MIPQGEQSIVSKLLDFGLGNIDLWRSEEMQLVQVSNMCGARMCRPCVMGG